MGKCGWEDVLPRAISLEKDAPTETKAKGRELSSFRSQSIRSIEVETITEARVLLDVLVLQIVAECCAIDASLIAFPCRDYAVQSNRQT